MRLWIFALLFSVAAGIAWYEHLPWRVAPDAAFMAFGVDIHTPRGKAIAEELRHPTVYADCKGNGDVVPTYPDPSKYGGNLSATCENGIWLVDGENAPSEIERAAAYVDAREERRAYAIKCPTGCGWSPVTTVNIGTLGPGESATITVPLSK